MTNLEFSGILFVIAYFAGLIGALTGLGGGIIIVPALVLLLNVDFKYAMGASLVSVIATSSGAALTFLRQHYTNLKIGMFLEMGAIIGAVVGAMLVKFLPTSLISIVFGVVLLSSAWLSFKKRDVNLPQNTISHLPLGFTLMTIAGALSGLLGIGSGTLKVLSLDLAMGLPYKIATSTSNFMIGMTAAASAGIYLSEGYIQPDIIFPILPGVLIGALMGSKILVKAKPEKLRLLFTIIIFCLAIQMIYKGYALI